MPRCPNCGHDDRVDRVPVGRILKRKRNDLGLSQDEVLDRAESSREQSWLARLENVRKTVPEWGEFSRLCKALGLDPRATVRQSATIPP